MRSSRAWWSSKCPTIALRSSGILGRMRVRANLGQHLGISLAGDQGLQHSPARLAQHVGGHRVELDAGVLQQLLDALGLLGPLLGQLGPVAGQVPEPGDLTGWHEAAPQQTALEQLGQPGSVADIGLGTGQVLEWRGLTNISSTLGIPSSTCHTGRQYTPVACMATCVTPRRSASPATFPAQR